MPYDVSNFAPVSLISREVSVVSVHPSLPVKSIKELISLAKAKPGQLNYASGTTGAPNHLSAELFKSMAGVDIVRVTYKGGGPAMTALVGGEVQVSFYDVGPTMPHVKTGKLRALAVTSAEPSALAPGLPTVAASGVPGYESVGMSIILAPAKTPAAIINRLNLEVVRFLSSSSIKERFLAAGSEVVGSSAEQLAGIIKTDMARASKVIKEAGIKVD
jgi:tripartite-type tricarboxylate transporter receptor subunit TctC